MNINHNILVGGAAASDKKIREHWDTIKDHLYFRKPRDPGQILFKLVPVKKYKERTSVSSNTYKVDLTYKEGVEQIKTKNQKFDFEKDYTMSELCVAVGIHEKNDKTKAPGGKEGFINYKFRVEENKWKGYENFSKPNGVTSIEKDLKGEIIEKKRTNQTKKKGQTTKQNQTKKKDKKKPAKPAKPEQKSKKSKKSKKKEGEDFIRYLEEFLKNGTEFIKKHDINYNEHLKIIEGKNREECKYESEEDNILYPLLEDPDFNTKIWQKKEFKDGNEYPKRELSEGDKDKKGKEFDNITNNICNNFEFELLPHQKFIKNFLSFQTPYNSLLIYHGLGTGKTCSSIGVAEEYRTYANQMGINKPIIVVASEFVQQNFKKQLFDETKLKKVGGLWNIKSCTGNKFLKEINPMNMENLERDHVIKQVKSIIKENYEFMAYLEFATWTKKELNKEALNDKDSLESRKKKIQKIKELFSDRLIIIDEVHNIRDVREGDGIEEKKIKNKLKGTTEHFKTLVTYADNVKLLLLTGTPMYNEYKEIIWLLNLMNLNDNRYFIEESDIFDNDGEFVKDDDGNEIGKDILIQKSRGYVSFVKGEDPFMFPFRVYPEHDTTLQYDANSLNKLKRNNSDYYPKKQLNGMDIPVRRNETRGVQYLDIFMTKIGEIQKDIYENYIKKLMKDSPNLKNFEKFSYGMLSTPSQLLNICYPSDERDIKYKYGERGLGEIMKFNKTSWKEFEYKENHEGFFKIDKLKEYSGKITRIIKEIVASTGIILIYSQYIAGGCIPVALALEEAGYSKYGGSIFKRSPAGENKGEYIMITGQTKSKELIKTLNLCNSKENKDGTKIKVVIISRAGSEGLDFANIRQVHILDAWYNLNRTGQIEGRAIRNLSHCNLEIKERNVLIFLHGTKGVKDEQQHEEVEAIDMYMYRIAEEKAILSGKIARILKENAVDCLLNENQKQSNKENLKLTKKIKLSNGNEIDFAIGHHDNTQICDFMDCNYQCKPQAAKDWKENVYTYNDKYMTLTVTKIIEIIKRLFKEKYVFNQRGLMDAINFNRKYKKDEIFNALSILIDDKTEYIEDNLKRKGRLVNIADLYLFQPLEISYEQLTMYQRKHPIPYKRGKMLIELNQIKKKEFRPDIVVEKLIDQLKYCWKDVSQEDTTDDKIFYYHIPGIINYLLKYFPNEEDELRKFAAFKLIDTMKDNFKTKLHLLNQYTQDKYKENDIIHKVIGEYFNNYIFNDGVSYCVIPNFKERERGILVCVKLEETEYKRTETHLEEILLKKFIEKKGKKREISKFYDDIGFTTFLGPNRKDEIIFKYKNKNTDGKGNACRMQKTPLLITGVNNLLKELGVPKNKWVEFSDGTIGGTKISSRLMCVLKEFLFGILDRKNEDRDCFFMTAESILYGIEELPKIRSYYQKQVF
jgi:hypothetical protein